MKNGAIRIILLLILQLAAQARSKGSAEAAALSSIQASFELFFGAAERFPTNWAEVKSGISLSNLNTILVHKPESFSIQRHYIFVPEPMNLRDVRGRRILLIRTEPITEAGRESPIRHMIVEQNGVSFPTLLKESEVQQLLRKASGRLPRPDIIEAKAAEAAVRAMVREKESWRHDPVIALTVWKLAAQDLIARISGFFVVAPDVNAEGSPSGRPGKLSFFRIAFAGIAFIAIMLFVAATWIRRRQSAARVETDEGK